MDKAKINFPSKKTGTELDKLFEDTTELIIGSYRERYALLKKDKDDITRAMIEFKLKIQDFVRVLDEVYTGCMITILNRTLLIKFTQEYFKVRLLCKRLIFVIC